MKFTVYNEDTPLMYVDMGFKKINEYKVLNPLRKFMWDTWFLDGKLSYNGFKTWLKKRTIPEERINRDEIIRELYHLNPNFAPMFALLQIDHGVNVLDNFWLKFEGENLEYKDVRCR